MSAINLAHKHWGMIIVRLSFPGVFSVLHESLGDFPTSKISISPARQGMETYGIEYSIPMLAILVLITFPKN